MFLIFAAVHDDRHDRGDAGRDEKRPNERGEFGYPLR
jgi:hypothetical protein